MKTCKKGHQYSEELRQCPNCLKNWYKNNKEKNRAKIKKWELANPDKVRAKTIKWQQKNLDKINEKNRARYKKDPSKKNANKKRWSSNNPDYQAKYSKQRRKKDIQFLLSGNLRTRLYKALKGNYKSGSAIKDLGCSISELKKYLENKFQPGMSWDNYGEWHIDHITPLSNFDLTNKIELRKACHYTNLQPLWKIDNLRKGNKI